MRVGDLVKLCEEGYPQFVGGVGILVTKHRREWWLLMMGSKIIQIHQDNLKVINE